MSNNDVMANNDKLTGTGGGAQRRPRCPVERLVGVWHCLMYARFPTLHWQSVFFTSPSFIVIEFGQFSVQSTNHQNTHRYYCYPIYKLIPN